MMLSEITTSGFVYTIISFAKIIVLLSEIKGGSCGANVNCSNQSLEPVW